MVKAARWRAPIIVVSGWADREAALECLRAGAQDFVAKSELPRLAPTIRSVLEHQAARQEKDRAEASLRDSQHQLETSKDTLRALAVRLQLAQEDERARFSRDLHDGLGQGLTLLRIKAAELATLAQSHGDAAIARELEGLVQMADSLLETTHFMANELRPRILDALGLIPAFRSCLKQFSQITRVEAELLTAMPEGYRLPRDVETALFRIVQEGLNNVVRHAQATQAVLRITEEQGEIALEVKDNGRGFQPGELEKSLSLGLVGMRHRALIFGGTVKLENQPGGGARLRVHVPPPRMPETTQADSEPIHSEGGSATAVLPSD
jgi:signal transduction histidine kinase